MTEDKPLYQAPLDANQIRAILPHRPPFLLVDKVLELVPGKSIKARKCVSQNDPWFEGHFPGRPTMPGVLMIEAIAQAGAIMILTLPEFAGKIAVMGSIQKAKFRRIVLPGDVLDLESELISFKMGVGKASGRLTVDGELAAEGLLSFAIID